MGKFDKEAIERLERRFAEEQTFTRDRAAHMFDVKAEPTVDSFGRLNPTQDQLDQLARTLGRIREGGQPLAAPQRQTTSETYTTDRGSQRSPKEKYVNRSSRGFRR